MSQDYVLIVVIMTAASLVLITDAVRGLRSLWKRRR
jgi:hypothetical protein